MAKQWDESSFFAELQARYGIQIAKVAKEIIEWARNNELTIAWGKGESQGGVQIQYNGLSIISPKISGKVTIWFSLLERSNTPFVEEQKRLDLLYKLNEIQGINIHVKYITLEPFIPISIFINTASLRKFFKIIEWVKQQIKYTDNEFTEPIKSADLEEPPQRIKSETTRIVRDTALTNSLKELHRYKCQFCGMVIQLPDGSRYSEAHHIKPLGGCHEGPDITKNIIVVCPNHHAMLDLGVIRLTIKDIQSGHEIGSEFIDYHNTVIYRGKI